MSRLDIIRAWKDKAYRNGLSAEQKAMLPENPAGAVELSDAEAATIEGKLAYAICSSCHGCTRAVSKLQMVSNPAPMLRF